MTDMGTSIETRLKELPQLGVLLEKDSLAPLKERFGTGMLKLCLKEAIADARHRIIHGKMDAAPGEGIIVSEALAKLERLATPDGRRAINATGILLHTALGRAPFCGQAIEQMQAFGGYSVLQADLGSGKRSLREEKIEKMLVELTGCEAATVVNNNAAATMLILNTLADGKEVIVSRGQLIEIGGEFRLPDVMRKSGCILRDVGTTNRTHLKDYESAICENTGAVIHVHTSNYRIRGFAGTPSVSELRLLLRKYPGVPLIDDLGCGALIPLSEFGLPDEPTVQASLSAGTDVVCFSGDKLICGPQSGIICGKKEIVDRIRKNPFARMFRVCKMTVAALEATLAHFINGTYRSEIPFYRLLSAGVGELEERASALKDSLKGFASIETSLEKDFAYVGSGSIPDEGVPSVVLRISQKCSADFAEKISRRLRENIPAVFCRISVDSLVFDMRSLRREDFDELKTILSHLFQGLMR